ncbi:MAG: hypothetical protein ABIP48_12245 [Planctomycetota bacterium]
MVFIFHPVASFLLPLAVTCPLAIAGIWLHRRREPLPGDAVQVDGRELRLVKLLFAMLLALALVLSPLAGNPALFLPIVLSFVIWTPLGFLLTTA